MSINQIISKTNLTDSDLFALLSCENTEDESTLFQTAYQTKLKYVSNKVYLRGLIEFSNICEKNCFYCGIRKDNKDIKRFRMSKEEILTSAKWALDNNYASIVLQSGERSDSEFTEFITSVVREIKEVSLGKLGITLCLGEQSFATYQAWFNAGAHRYLLRIETSNPELYSKIHPVNHNFFKRVECLQALTKIGYQTGTGVMIGFPGQTIDHLVQDILFFKKMNVDMLGMGPYVVHKDTPMGEKALNSESEQERRFKLALKMIACCRIFLKDVNIAATTALQALNPTGRELGLQAGANVIMPVITELTHRKDYLLYDGKPCIDDDASHCKSCLENRIRSVGDEIAYGSWGDPIHFKHKK